MSYQRPPESSRGLAFFLLCIAVLFLLLMTQDAHGQNGNPSGPLSLSENLEQAEMNLQTLMLRLTERRQQISDLQSNLHVADSRLTELADSLAVLQTQLVAAQESASNSQTALQETSTSLASLSMRYDELERDWQTYRREMVKQVTGLEREVRRAKIWAGIFLGGTIAGAIGCIILALR